MNITKMTVKSVLVASLIAALSLHGIVNAQINLGGLFRKNGNTGGGVKPGILGLNFGNGENGLNFGDGENGLNFGGGENGLNFGNLGLGGGQINPNAGGLTFGDYDIGGISGIPDGDVDFGKWGIGGVGGQTGGGNKKVTGGVVTAMPETGGGFIFGEDSEEAGIGGVGGGNQGGGDGVEGGFIFGSNEEGGGGKGKNKGGGGGVVTKKPDGEGFVFGSDEEGGGGKGKNKGGGGGVVTKKPDEEGFVFGSDEEGGGGKGKNKGGGGGVVTKKPDEEGFVFGSKEDNGGGGNEDDGGGVVTKEPDDKLTFGSEEEKEEILWGSFEEGGDGGGVKVRFNKTVTFIGGCTSWPTYKINGQYGCNKKGCRARCLPNYRFRNGETEIALVCRNGVWQFVTTGYKEIPVCEPICLPECKNNGICIKPNQCNCPAKFTGPQCQFENKPCLNPPPKQKYGKVTFSSKTATIECYKDHTFSDGTTVANLVCKHGNWEPTRNDWNTIPECKPVCHPACQNGGICLSKISSNNVCQCPKNFVGPQCQYIIDNCDPSKKLNFNGDASCESSGDMSLSCVLSCPTQAQFEYPPASQYVCRYDRGTYEPTPIPQCKYPPGNITDRVTKEINGTVTGGDGTGGGGNEDDGKGHIIDRITKIKEGGSCFGWSGKHYKTFDGQVLSINSNCSYVLLKETQDGLFTVIAQNDPLCQNKEDCPRLIRIFVGGREYDLAANPVTRFPEVRQGKKIVPIPSQLPDLRVETETGQFISVSVDSVGLKIKWNGEKVVQLDVTEALWNRTAGLCGILNGERKDDFGPIVKSVLHGASQWKVEDIGEKCEEYPSKQNPCGSDIHLEQEAGEFCQRLLSDARYSQCAQLVDFNGFLGACKWDYCSCNSDNAKECSCETMGVYVRQCAQKGLVILKGWRDEKLCPLECPDGKVYMECGPEIQPSCGAEVALSADSKDCEEGCFCPTGSVLHEGHCIRRNECPCKLRGKSFKAGETVTKDCNTCVCVAGQWTCTETTCSARCSAIGDPHYTTFDGKRYDFMGKCSYYLVKGDNYSIEAENAPCTSAISELMGFTEYNNDEEPSCTKTVTIKANNVAIKLKQNRQILVNGEDVPNLPVVAGGMDIRVVSSIFIAVDLPNGLQVLWDGSSRVYVNAPPELKGKTKGLCGTFNENQKDDFLTPDGDIEQVVSAFANKWKTSDNCPDTKIDPDNPCEVNAHKKDTAEKYCSVLKKKLFLACHWYADPEPFYKDCLYDMCSCKEKIGSCLCPSLSTYAKECAHYGVNIPWRQTVQECRVHCPGDQEYQVCGNSCARSCGDISSTKECKEECVEGCNCPKGQTLDVHGDCIPTSQCPCINNGLVFPAGYKEIRPGTKSQQLCTCLRGLWSCRTATLKEIDDYPGMEKLKTLCSAAKHQILTTCEPVEQRTCSNMHRHVYQSPAICRPGCVCKAGYVLDAPTNKCVLQNKCPCYHGGKSYKEGDVRQKDCNTCKCVQGIWNCTDIKCPGICSVWGDSHYKTFDDKLFDFQGACEYVLAKGKISDDEAFDVTIRNVACGTTGVTCSKAITLVVGKTSTTPGEEVTLTRGTKLNWDELKQLKRIVVRESDLYIFLDVPDLGIVVQWDRGTRVYLRVHPKWKSRTKGLCGDFNDNAEDDFKTPSGGLSEASASIFGDSWKLNEFCAEPDEKPPKTCDLRPERRMWATQKCRIMKSSVFERCHSEVSPEEYIERCIFDACGCDEGGDCECLCTAIAAYAQECNTKGVPIEWRDQTFCPIQCDETCSKVSPCVSTCPHETCDNFVTLADSLHLCDQDACVEGCLPKECPEGQIYLNSSYSECVPRRICKPVCLVINGTTYYEGDKVHGDKCHTCYCSRGKKVCVGQPCGIDPRVPGDDSKDTCKSGWTDWWNIDRPKDDGPRDETEPLPALDDLKISESKSLCNKDMMVDIICREVGTKKSHKEVGLNVDCNLDVGFICRRSDNNGKTCPDFEISVLCKCEDNKITTKVPPTGQPPTGRPPTGEPPTGRPPTGEPPTGRPPTGQPPTGKPTGTPTTLEPTTITPPPISCEITRFYPYPLNCHQYFQCETDFKGKNKWVRKSCGPDKLFNNVTNVCDLKSNVLGVRPDCEEGNEIVPKICDPTEHWDDCAIKCSRTCHGYNKLLVLNEICNRTIECVGGCVPDKRPKCEGNDNYWLNERTCVHISDCNCISDMGMVVLPGEIVRENDCKTCQCLNNHYTCDESACLTTTTAQPETNGTTTPRPTIPPDDETIIVPPIGKPPPDCEDKKYGWLIEQQPPGSVNFKGSSYRDASIKSDSIRLNRKITPNIWRPNPKERRPYVQIELPESQPIYGIVIGGNPYTNNFVTGVHVVYGDDGVAFTPIGVQFPYPDVIRGPADSSKPVQSFFTPPIEARYVRIYGFTWEGEASMQVELLGCGKEEEEQTTPEPTTATPVTVTGTVTLTSPITPPETTTPKIQPVCDDPMGYDNGNLDPRQVSVSSTHDKKEPDLRISSKTTWHPFLNNPDQYVQFDFLEPRNLTGVETRGGDGTWVTQYTVKYSKDGVTWSPILDEYGANKKFLGNIDDSSSHVNYFDRTINARYIRIHPHTWHDAIGMKVEIRGCYRPYPKDKLPSTTTTEKPEPECNVCPGIEAKDKCDCEKSQWWDGEKCIAVKDCPCVVNGVSYPVGSTYETAKCEICICAMSGVPLCKPKTCPPCSNRDHRPVVSELCTCLCKECPTGQRLCRTNNECIDKEKWCDGVKDCPDDEDDECETVVTEPPTKITTPAPPTKIITKVVCITKCPPGFDVIHDEDWARRIAHLNVTVKEGGPYQKSLTLKIPPTVVVKNQKAFLAKICPKIKCQKEVEEEDCDNVQCPRGLKPVINQLKNGRKSLHCIVTCVPIPPKVHICRLIGKTFVTFDQLIYKYQICNHVLARDMDENKWYVVVQEVCPTDGKKCQKIVVIVFDNQEVVLRPDMTVSINGQNYDQKEVLRLGDKDPSFKVTRIGKILRFESKVYPFWVMLDAFGKILVGVSEELAQHVDGLCGFFDGISENDQQKPNKEIAKNTNDFGDSWKLKNTRDCKEEVCPPEVKKETWEVCTSFRDPLFEQCGRVLDRETYISSCLDTHCACRLGGNVTKQQCLCEAIESFVTTCLAVDKRLDLSNWRAIYGCADDCKPPLVSKDCFRKKCELTCENLVKSESCWEVSKVCATGCFCPEGTVRQGDKCVKPPECRDCVCDGLGRSRYVTYDRKTLLFNGNCTYLLSRDIVKGTDGQHKFEVYVTNGQCGKEICTQVITVVYDGHIFQIRRGNEPDEVSVLLDDKEVAFYPLNDTKLSITRTPNLDVQLFIPEIQLELTVYRPHFDFTLRLPSHIFGGIMEGLCGNCNGRRDDDFKKVDGKITTSHKDFGDSWSIKNLPEGNKYNFDDKDCVSEPIVPCIEKPTPNGFCEKLLKDVSFTKCHGVVDPIAYYKACKESLCRGGNTCTDFEAYARMCKINGVCLDWRKKHLCPYDCPENLRYKACGSGCLENCDTVKNPETCVATPVEGCFCPPDQVLKDKTCVPVKKCFPCDKDGHVEDDIWHPDKCTQCTCKNNVVSCSHTECPQVDVICDDKSDAKVVEGTENDCCPKFICVPKEQPDICPEILQPNCGFGQTLKTSKDDEGCMKYSCECVPEDQCALLTNKTETELGVLQPGFVKEVDKSGCCPRVTKVCKPETCPPVKECPKYYTTTTIASSELCCKEVICKPPEDLCLYYLESKKDDNLVAHKIGETWQDGVCKKCTCELEDGKPTSKCVTKQCIKLEDHPDVNEYELDSHTVENECCAVFERIACKVKGKVKKIGEKWLPNPDDSCVEAECVNDNGVTKKQNTKICTDKCELGAKYVESNDKSVECCGICVPIACVVDGKIKNVGDTWISDDNCVKSSCVNVNGSLVVKSETETCEKIDPQEELNYKIELIPLDDECCPTVERIACKVNNTVYKPGSEWKDPIDPCIIHTCVTTDDGQVTKSKEVKTCHGECPKGWVYEESQDPKVCCGECKQKECIVDGKLYKPGQVWYSKDNCTMYECIQKKDQLIVSTSSETCPKIDCDPKYVIHDGCCKRCKEPPKPEKNCVKEVVDPKTTVGLISENKPDPQGLCENEDAIEGLTECHGNCDSSSRLNGIFLDQELDCSCCQPVDYKKIDIELTCKDNSKIKKTLTVPEKCSCSICVGEKRPKNQTPLQRRKRRYVNRGRLSSLFTF